MRHLGYLGAAMTALAVIGGQVCADVVSQNFDDFGANTAPQTSITHNAWTIHDGLGSTNQTANSLPAAGWLIGGVWSSKSYTNSYVETPVLSNGVGTLTFYLANRLTPTNIAYDVQASVNGGAYSNVANGGSSSVRPTWTLKTHVFNIYDPVSFRIRKRDITASGEWMGIDDVATTEAPARVLISDIRTDPEAPAVNDAVTISSQLAPSALVSNLTVELLWWAGAETNTIAMSPSGGGYYETDTAVPGHGEGTPVQYMIRITFAGPSALSPVVATGGYEVQGRPFLSDYADGEMLVRGSITTNMTQIDDYLWEAILSSPTAVTDATVSFAGRTNKSSSATNVWGDAAQTTSLMPFQGTGDLDGAPIAIDTLPAGQTLVRFRDANLTYLVNEAVFHPFSTWTGAEAVGTHTNAGWVIANGRVGTAVDGGWVGVVLENASTSYVRSPAMPDGIGEVAFWYRLHGTNKTPVTDCYVEVSKTGGASPGDWATVATIANIQLVKHNRYSLLLNDRYNRYVRVRNGGGARLVVDELLVAHAGAGVILTNLQHAPLAPTASDPVTVSVDVESRDSATGLVVTAHYRAGAGGPYTAVGMTLVSGNTYETSTPIPGGSGDGNGGAGLVQYYVDCAFTGFQSAAASPIPFPEDGDTAPYAFQVLPATVSFSNASIPPSPIYVGSNTHIFVDILPAAGATNIAATLFYRFATSGGFSTAPMSLVAAPGSMRTQTPIPSPAGAVPGMPFQYYVRATFTGPSAVSPTNHPVAGESAPFGTVLRRPQPASGYTGLTVEGTLNTNFLATSDYNWQAVAYSSSFTDADVRFRGQGASPTVWGASNQTVTTPPIFGYAAVSAADIQIDGTYSGHVVFAFSETNRAYTVQLGTHQNFDTWNYPAYGSYTNDGWTVTGARTTAAGNAFAGVSLELQPSAGTRAIESPTQVEGIGEVSFWYRAAATNGLAPSEIAVQVWHEGLSAWETIRTITNIISVDYLHTTVAFSDRNKHRVRIASLAGTAANATLIDHFTIARPGPGLLFANLQHAPANPTIFDEVAVTVDITASANASNPVATLWFRAGDNGVFDPIPMVPTGAVGYVSATPIPRGEIGQMQYYIECSYSIPQSPTRLTSYEPTDRTGQPASYTNTDVASAADGFESWPTVTPTTNLTVVGEWTLSEGVVNATFGARTGTKAAWLIGGPLAGKSWTNSYLASSLQPRGIGSFSFFAKNNRIAVSEFAIETTEDGSIWTPFVNDTSSSLTNWVLKSYTFATTNVLGVRVRKTDYTQDREFIGIDDVLITYPPAVVMASDFRVHPAYPADDDPVEVSCTIETRTTFFPAFNITGQLYYRKQGTTPWQGPIAMSRDGTLFRTVTGIPAFPVASTVEFYLRSAFNGYHDTGEDRSPMNFPDGAPGTVESYDIRRHKSSYASVYTSINGAPQALQQVADGSWQTVLYFPTPTNDASLSISGHDFYDGTNTTEGLATTWGDSDQTRTTIPYASTLQPDGSNIVMYGTHEGQFVLKFNEYNLSYALLKAVYQDFDRWPASSSFFETSISSETLKSYEQSFDNALWPTSVYNDVLLDIHTFNGWTNSVLFPPTVPYPSGFTKGPDKWLIGSSLIITQEVGQASMMNPSPGYGYIRLVKETTTPGAGVLSCDLRCANTDMHPALHAAMSSQENLMFEAKVYATDLAQNSMPSDDQMKSIGKPFFSMLVRHQGTNYLELRVEVDYNTAKDQYDRWVTLYRVSGSTRTSVWNRRWDGLNITNKDTYRLILSSFNGSGNMYYMLFINDARHAGPDSVDWTPQAGGGSIGFYSQDASIAVEHVTAGHAVIQCCRGWPTTTNYTTVVDKDGWQTRDAYINDNDDEFILRGSTPSNHMAYIRSPAMQQGLGTIRFSYRRNGDAGTTVASALLQYSTTGGTNDTEWTTFQTNQVTSTAWSNWDTWSAEPDIAISNVYFRIAVTNTAGTAGDRLRIDNIAIQPSRTLAYFNNFATNATGWSDPSGKWYRQSSDATYRRPGYTGEDLAFAVQTAPSAKDGDLEDDASWTTVATHTGFKSTPYIRFSQVIHNPNDVFVRLKHTTGTGSLVVDNIQITPWHAETRADSNGWAIGEAWIGSLAPDTHTNVVEFMRSRAYTNRFQYMRSPWMTNGVGNLQFDYRGISASETNPVIMGIQATLPGDTNAWETLVTVTNNPTAWTPYSWTVDKPGNLYVRVVNLSPAGDAGFYVDNPRITERLIVNDQAWQAYNALISGTRPELLMEEEGNIKGGFLNHVPGPFNPDTIVAFTNHYPFIESARLSNGVGEISFWYRSFSGVPATIEIRGAASRATPDDEWTILGRITNVTSTSYAFFSTPQYERNLEFVRFVTATNPGAGRACLDNILIASPYGADLAIRNVTPNPPIPLYNDSVHVTAELYDFFLQPTNIAMTLHWRTGQNDWGDFSAANEIPMSLIASNLSGMTFMTTAPIPAQPVDTVVQYYVSAEFEGLFSNISSPNNDRTFTNPDWYHPIDLNAGQSLKNPYYFSFSCLPGQVWINELNVIDSTWPDVDQYIEICGPSDVDIGNWKIKVYNNQAYALDATYTLPPSTRFINETNRYGFWVLGDPEVGARDMTLTNPIPVPGGIQLLRSMGAIEHAVCFDGFTGGQAMTNNPAYRFVYIGSDDDLSDTTLSMYGTGSNKSSFAWTWEAFDYNPGAINLNQTLIPWSTNDTGSAEEIVLEITSAWMSSNQVYFRLAGSTNSLSPTPWYSTNLFGAWTPGANAGYAATGTSYTVWCDKASGPRGCFYKITHTTP